MFPCEEIGVVNPAHSRAAIWSRLIPVLSIFVLFGCGIASGTVVADSHSTPAAKNTIPAAAHEEHRAAQPAHKPTVGDRPAHLLVILIGGMDSDPTHRQIAGTATRKEGNSGLYRLRGDLHEKRVTPEYFNWNGSRAGELNGSGSGDVASITRFIEAHLTRHPHDRLAIVGNSWGGHTAWEVITQLRERQPEVAVSLAVFLDGSSTGRAPQERKGLPTNIVQSLNIYTRNTFVWGKLPPAPRQENIDLGDPTQGFLRQAGPPYDAVLNFKAHVSAEWDEEIHSLIRRRLLALVPKEDEKTAHQTVTVHTPHASHKAPEKKTSSPVAGEGRGEGHGGAGH